VSLPASPGRGSSAPGGASAAAGTVGSTGKRNPHLGVQLLGYSRRRTNALLDDAAAMIERLSGEVVEHRRARVEAEAQAAHSLAKVDELRGRLDDLDSPLGAEASTERNAV
jgi:hypothetical protein